MSVGFKVEEKLQDLFGDRLERTFRAVLMAKGGNLFAVEVDSHELLRNLSFELSAELLTEGYKVKEIFLPQDGALSEALTKLSDDAKGVAFLYLFIEPSSFNFIADQDLDGIIALFRVLNMERDAIAQKGWTIIIWGRPEQVKLLAQQAKDLWSCMSGDFPFLLNGRGIEPLPFSRDLTPVEAANLRTVGALGEVEAGDERVIVALLRALKDGNVAVQNTAFNSLWELTWTPQASEAA